MAEQQRSHEQPTFEIFDTEPTLEERRSAISEAIAQAAVGRTVHTERNPGTQRMIDDLGGGEPRETLLQDPPRIRRQDRRPTSKKKGMSAADARAQSHAENERRYGLSGRVTRTSEEQAVFKEQIAKLRAALPPKQ